MQPRIEMKINGEVVAQIMCKPGVSDGDLAAMVEDAAQDLHWSVTRDVETRIVRTGPIGLDGQGQTPGSPSQNSAGPS